MIREGGGWKISQGSMTINHRGTRRSWPCWRFRDRSRCLRVTIISHCEAISWIIKFLSGGEGRSFEGRWSEAGLAFRQPLVGDLRRAVTHRTRLCSSFLLSPLVCSSFVASLEASSRTLSDPFDASTDSIHRGLAIGRSFIPRLTRCFFPSVITRGTPRVRQNNGNVNKIFRIQNRKPKLKN